MVTMLAARSQMTGESAQTAKTNQNSVVLAEEKLCCVKKNVYTI